MAIEQEMKVGPKGQVVIPRVFRSALKMDPGSKIVVRLENDRVVLEKKAKWDVAMELERIAKSGRSINKISPHAYEDELEKRYRH